MRDARASWRAALLQKKLNVDRDRFAPLFCSEKLASMRDYVDYFADWNSYATLQKSRVAIVSFFPDLAYDILRKRTRGIYVIYVIVRARGRSAARSAGISKARWFGSERQRIGVSRRRDDAEVAEGWLLLALAKRRRWGISVVLGKPSSARASLRSIPGAGTNEKALFANDAGGETKSDRLSRWRTLK